MRNILQAVLTFLLNGVWQIAAVALFAVLETFAAFSDPISSYRLGCISGVVAAAAV